MVFVATVGLGFKVHGGSVFVAFDLVSGAAISSNRVSGYWSGWSNAGWAVLPDGETMAIHVRNVRHNWNYDETYIVLLRDAWVRAFTINQRQLADIPGVPDVAYDNWAYIDEDSNIFLVAP